MDLKIRLKDLFGVPKTSILSKSKYKIKAYVVEAFDIECKHLKNIDLFKNNQLYQVKLKKIFEQSLDYFSLINTFELKLKNELLNKNFYSRLRIYYFPTYIF